MCVCVHIRVPVLFGDAVQAAKHDGQDLVDVLLDQTQDVLVIPEVERPLCHLHGGQGSSQFDKIIPFSSKLHNTV